MKKRLFSLLLILLLLSGCQAAPAAPQGSVPEEGSSFAVHFIDVGQADAALVVCDGHYMLIDGGNAADSDLIYAYLKEQGASHLDYMVATHAHEDHIGGLPGALNYAQVDTALSPVTQGSTQVFENLVQYLSAQHKSLTVPQPGDSFALGSAQVEILGPVKEYDDTNDTSIVLRVDYGQTSFLFTGDMEREAEEDLLEAGARLDATVLKVGHHGSETSTSYPFLREVLPEYAVISVGEDNSYGHPDESTLSRLRDAQVQVYRTDLQGTIIAASDGTSVTFQTEKATSIPTNPTQPQGEGYVGNSSSLKFHLPSCSSVADMSPDNQVHFDTREQALEAGYSPCQRCKPRRRRR